MRMPGNHGLPSLAAIHPPGLGPDAGSLAWFGAPRRWRNPAACHWTPEDQLGAPGAGMPRSSSPHLGTCIPRPRIASRRVPRRSCPVHPDEPGSRRACCRPGEVSLLGCHLDPERSMHGRGLRCVSRLMGRGLRRSYKGARRRVGALGRRRVCRSGVSRDHPPQKNNAPLAQGVAVPTGDRQNFTGRSSSPRAWPACAWSGDQPPASRRACVPCAARAWPWA